MSLSYRTSRVRTSQAQLKRKVSSIKECLNISDKDWLDVLKMTSTEYANMMKNKANIPITALYHICDTFQLSMSSFSQEASLDTTILNERYRKANSDFIHPKYTIAAYSKRHTVLTALHFIETHRGKYLRETINQYFHTNDAVWREPNSSINILFLTDLWNFLKTQGFTQADFFKLGQNSFNTHCQTIIGSKLSYIDNFRDLYDFTFSELISQFENNCHYRITHLTTHRCIVESQANPDVLDLLKITRLGSPLGCQVRSGIISSMNRFIGLPYAQVTELNCIHHGNKACRFEINLI